MLKKTWAWIVVGAIAILGGWFGWRQRNQDESFVDAVIADLEFRTVRAGSRRLGPIETNKTATSVKASWEIETDQPWDDYCSAVSEQLRKAGYEESHRDEGKLVFGKSLPGDRLRVSIEKVAEKPLHLRVAFVAHPS